MSDHSRYCNSITDDFSEETSTYTIDSEDKNEWNDWNGDCEQPDNLEEKSGDELLIELYRERPFLYDKSNASFKNSIMKQSAWDEISKIMIQTNNDDTYTPSYCQKRCISLRDQYNREKKKAEIECKSGSAAGKASKFPFFSQLTFLDRVIKRRRSYTNCTKSQSINVEDNSTCKSQSGTSNNETSENENNLHSYKSKNFNKENVAPKKKKRKIDETKELEQTLVQMGQRISNYMENKVSTANDAFMEFLKIQFNSIPENEQNIRRKMMIDVLTAPLPET